MVGVYSMLETTAPKENAFYGFISRTHFLLSTAVSVMLSKKWFERVIIYTDYSTWEHLKVIGHLFDEVIFITEKEVPSEIRKTWAVGKMYVYANMNEPFCHIDNDVYLKTPLAKIYTERYDVVAQSIEIYKYFSQYYNKQLSKINELDSSPLSCYIENFKDENLAYNAGIFGGSNYKLINEIYKEVFDFLLLNKPTFDLSISLEQTYVAMYCKSKGIKIETIISEKYDFKKQSKEMMRKGYVHLLSHYKREGNGKNVIKHCKEWLLTNDFETYKIIFPIV